MLAIPMWLQPLETTAGIVPASLLGALRHAGFVLNAPLIGAFRISHRAPAEQNPGEDDDER
eukprot:2818631-Alexandrium_andersonii.AAC.1